VLPPRVRRRMEAVGLPVGLLLAVVAYLGSQGELVQPTYDAIEFFAGVASWTNALASGGLNTATFEILSDPIKGDILSPEGPMIQ
jgi:hypothetical protein